MLKFICGENMAFYSKGAKNNFAYIMVKYINIRKKMEKKNWKGIAVLGMKRIWKKN